MNFKWLSLVLVFLYLVTGCNDDNKIQESVTGWPDAPSDLLDHLNNNWNKTELREYAISAKGSSETISWVKTHRSELGKLGYDINWSEEVDRFIFSQKPHPDTNQ